MSENNEQTETLGDWTPPEDDQASYPVGCVLCGSKHNVLIFPHRVKQVVVGLLYVCNPHASILANGACKISFDENIYRALEIKPEIVP